MTDLEVERATRDGAPSRYDAIIIGAGYAGLYTVKKLRDAGLTVRALEVGDGVGGTWYWNRYPGARVDIQSIEYSYTFDEDLQHEWEWTELMASQPELERYLNWVTDRLDLRRDIQLETRVTALTWDEAAAEWTVETDVGDSFVSRWVVAATGCLSAPLEPDIKGLHTFAGDTLYTNRFPKEGYDFTGKRVAVVGTGSSGVQAIPVIAEEASRLHVFQRSAAYTRPADNRPWEPGELDALKADYASIRAAQRDSFIGATRFGAVTIPTTPPARKILETPEEERLRILEEEGWAALSSWADVMFDIDANTAAKELYAEMIRRGVRDPETAQALVPHYPMGCKRPIIDIGYFDAFNRDNVTLVDLRKGGITEITPTGIVTEQGTFEFDVIVFATGFDAMTGALNRIDIKGRQGRLLRDVWSGEGAVSYLGVQVSGFPNLFTVTGPGSPSVLTNMVMSIEHHVEWIADCLTYLREHGLRSIEPTEEAQSDWVDHVASLVVGVVRTSDACNSWYLGANVPGKKRVYMPYAGGLPAYRTKCDEIVAAGYEGFSLA